MKEPKTFSFSEYADEFDQHITQSIRGYPDLRDDVVGISKWFVEQRTQVLDIGCSEGTLIERIAESNKHHNKVEYVGCEINRAFTDGWSKPERDYQSYNSSDASISRHDSTHVGELPHDVWWKGEIGGGTRLVCADILDWVNDVANPAMYIGIQPKNLSFVVSLFTMQFLPERYRLKLFQKIYDNLIDGGAFLTSEKIFAQNAKVQDMMDNLYYDFKRKSFSEKEILDKEQELRHLAKLTTENLLISQLRSVGFRGIQIFWRNFNFIGVLAMKRPDETWEEETVKTDDSQYSQEQVEQFQKEQKLLELNLSDEEYLWQRQMEYFANNPPPLDGKLAEPRKMSEEDETKKRHANNMRLWQNLRDEDFAILGHDEEFIKRFRKQEGKESKNMSDEDRRIEEYKNMSPEDRQKYDKEKMKEWIDKRTAQNEEFYKKMDEQDEEIKRNFTWSFFGGNPPQRPYKTAEQIEAEKKNKERIEKSNAEYSEVQKKMSEEELRYLGYEEEEIKKIKGYE